MALPFPSILLLLLFLMSSISLGAKNKKTGKTYYVRHKNQGWKIKTTGGREKVHNDDQKGKEEGHDDYQTELVDDTDDIYQDDYQNESNATANATANGTASNDTGSK